jgi:voltage-gated potassium channel Kch
MQYDNQLFTVFDRLRLRLFERAAVHHDRHRPHAYPLILFGYHKGGHEFVSTFREIGQRYVVVDYDPAVIEHMDRLRIPSVYGDATDPELLEELGVGSAKLVVSTFTDAAVTQGLVTAVRRLNPEAVIVCHAGNQEEALALYDLGATYVMLPHFIGSEKVSAFIRQKGLKKDEFEHFRTRHLGRLRAHHESLVTTE